MNEIQVTLREWEHRRPDAGTSLAGLRFKDARARDRARQLTSSGRLEVLELAQGIAVRTTSFVGRVRLGRLVLTVQPKIEGMPLLTLLRYAYGLRHLGLFPSTEYESVTRSFQDLLIHQLAAEVAELLARGLHREYIRTRQDLASPRGRLDFQTYAHRGGTAKAVLPCVHHPRVVRTLVNQVLAAGLLFGVRMTDDLPLRTRLRRLVEILEVEVEPVRLNAGVMAEARRALDRRTAAYSPALTLIEMLWYGAGLSLDERRRAIELPGFLFDMNLFFQAALARFLREHLVGYQVREERRIKGMLTYVPEYNPRRRRSPEPRPDYVIQHDTHVVALLDAKYRDLWENPLPRDMLYQLAIYALSQGPGERAVILYPTLDPAAREARIAIRDPVYGGNRAYVVLRPVDLDGLSRLVVSPSDQEARRASKVYARYLAFGKG
jgi:5-methylcytosine-specific restriction enzyme subunit McrC